MSKRDFACKYCETLFTVITWYIEGQCDICGASYSWGFESCDWKDEEEFRKKELPLYWFYPIWKFPLPKTVYNYSDEEF